MEVVVVAAAAVVAGAGAADLWLLAHALLGTFLVAAGASTWNQWIEPSTDCLMNRTAGRPLAAGRMSRWEAAAFGAAVTLGGLAYLHLWVNPSTAVVGVVTWLTYVVLYTPLKSRSSANTAVGAVSGALPVLMGWTAVGRPLDLGAAVLFTILFLWQFPHVMAVAWTYRRQYEAAGLKMMPDVGSTGRLAGAQAAAAALLLVPISLSPVLIGLARPSFLIGAIILGMGQLYFALAFLSHRNDRSARALFRATLVYLPTLLSWLAATLIRN